MSEVAQPQSEDELNFKEKHIVQHILDPNAEEDQFTADKIKKFKNRADYAKGEDIAVYEANMMLKRDVSGQEDDDVDNDGDSDRADAQLRHRRHQEIKKKIIDEAEMTPAKMKKREEIVKGLKKSTAGFKDRYGDRWKSVMYATATKRAMGEAIGPVTPAGGEFDSEESHKAYKKSNMSNVKAAHKHPTEIAIESVSQVAPKTGMRVFAGNTKNTKKIDDASLEEAFKGGIVKLNDGSSVILKDADAKLVNNLLNGLNAQNKQKMLKVAMTDKHGFNEILGFAREAM